MQSLLDKLPFQRTSRTVLVNNLAVEINSFQILVWVAICQQGQVEYDHKAPLVPAILDTGFNGYFCIREEQLRAWAGLDPRLLPSLHTGRTPRGIATVRRANIWLHRNVARSPEPLRLNPFQMELDDGIIVYSKLPPSPQHDLRPRMPLLGMRAFRRNELLLQIDFKRELVNLKKPRLFQISFGI